MAEVLLLAVVLGVPTAAGCSQPAVASGKLEAVQGAFDFEEYELVIGSAERLTLLTGFLLDGSLAELVVVNLDENEDGLLRVYTFDDSTWTLSFETTLRSDVGFVDVANIAGRDRLLTYTPGRLNFLDPDTGSEQELVSVTSSFEALRENEIPHVDVTRDVNADGRDDLVVPDMDGFWVFVQTEGGVFADPVKVGTSTDMSRVLGSDGYRYDPWSQSRIHGVDYNQDGRSDLVYWNEGQFEVHTQDEDGRFAPLGKSFMTPVVFESDKLSSLATGDMQGRVLHSLADLNGDGVCDLVVYALEGTKTSRKRSSYEVHFGSPDHGGGTTFATEVGHEFRTDGRVQLGMERHDFDRDGQVDLMLTTIKVKFLEGSLWKTIKGAMGDDVWLELEFYRMEGGHYPDKPNAMRRIALDGPPSHSEAGWVPLDLLLRGGRHENRKAQVKYLRAFNTAIRIGDVTGDGRSDLLLSDHPRIMNVFAGIQGPDLFTRRSQQLAMAIPNDEEYTWLVDLNQDGKQDILMHHPFTLRDAHGGRRRKPGSEPHRVNILISR